MQNTNLLVQESKYGYKARQRKKETKTEMINPITDDHMITYI